MTRSLTILAALALSACPAPPGDATATAGATTTTATSTAGTSGLSMSATSADALTTSTGDPGTTASTASTTASTTDTGCAFLDCEVDTDPGTQCLVENGELRCSWCDLWAQDCPEGQKCTPYANDGSNVWNAVKCAEVMPNAGKPGDACTIEGSGVSGVDSCEKAAMCWNVDQDTGLGTCVGFCTGSPDAPMCPADTTCVIANDGILILCLPTCDPLLQDCPGTDLCIPQPFGDSFVCVLDASGEMGAQNDPCEFANACDAGLACSDPALASECDPMAAGCCLPFCDLTTPECTNQGATCIPWYEMGTAPPGLENIGLCGLMP